MNLIKIDPKEIQLQADESGKFVLKPNAEEALDNLIKTRDLLVETVDQVLEEIKRTGEKIDPGFKGVRGKKYDLIKRKYGRKYTFKQNQTAIVAPFLKEVSYHMINSEAVDKYLEALGELPEGVLEKDREEKLTLRRKNESYATQLLSD